MKGLIRLIKKIFSKTPTTTPDQNQKVVDSILAGNSYVTLATCQGKKPWASPVVFLSDADRNLYFISPMSSLHAQNIEKNPNIAFAIFDSKQPLGTGTGIQGFGKAMQVGKTGLPKFAWDQFKNINGIPIALKGYAIFKVTPSKIYIPDEAVWAKDGVDARLEVPLKK